MSKRFIETTLWTQNKWFRKLKPHHKLLWVYLITNCDSVGVWEEDLELTEFIIGYEYKQEDLLIFGDRLKKFNSKKYWIKDFVEFQYGELKEENLTNKPHQSYISLLKKHSLWIDYKKSIGTVKEKDKDKDKDEEKYKEKDEEIESIVEIWNTFAKQNNLTKIIKLTDKRLSNVKNRLEEKEFDLGLIFDNIKKSDFLLGKNKNNWKIDFDFIFSSKNNYIKILEGKYNGKQQGITESELYDFAKSIADDPDLK